MLTSNMTVVSMSCHAAGFFWTKTSNGMKHKLHFLSLLFIIIINIWVFGTQAEKFGAASVAAQKTTA